MKSKDRRFPTLTKERLITMYWTLVGVSAAAIVSLHPVLADDIWTRLSTIVKDIYGELLGISTIVAVTAASVALLIRMISRNQRAVDEASAWLKRIIVCWAALMTLGAIVTYMESVIPKSMFTP